VPHLDDATLLAHFAGELDAAGTAHVLREIDECPQCADVAIALARHMPVSPDVIGTTIAGRYRIVAELGRGGMGVVYRAVDSVIERNVALKLVAIDQTDANADPRRELKVLGQLVHPAIVRIYDAGVEQAQVFVAMHEVQGQRLREWATQSKRSTSTVLRLFATLADALMYAHSQDVLHRDIKPSNVLVDDGDQPCLIDFGLASTTALNDRSRSVAGTLHYLAPELRTDSQATTATDQYAFFVTLFETLTGSRPVRGQNNATPGTGLPPRIATMLQRGIDADPTRRFSSMAEVKAELLALIEPAPRRWPWLLAIVCLAAGMAISLWVAVRSDRSSLVDAEPCNQYIGQIGLSDLLTSRSLLHKAPARSQAALESAVLSWNLASIDTCSEYAKRQLTAAQVARRQLCMRSTVTQFSISLPRASATRVLELLPDPVSCSDDNANVDNVDPSNAAAVQQIVALRADMADINSLSDTVDAAALLTKMALIVTRARAMNYAPLLAETLNQTAQLAENAGDFSAAKVALDEALVVATQSNNRANLARSYYINIMVQNALGVSTEVDRAIELARAATINQPAAATVRVKLAEHVVAIHRGRAIASISQLRNLLASCNELTPAQPVLCIDVHQALVAALFETRDVDAIKVELPILEQSIVTLLGNDNERYAVFLANQIGIGSLDESQAKAEKALAMLRKQSPNNPKIVALLENLGMIAGGRGDDKLGLSLQQQALAEATKRFGSNSAAVAHLEINVATSYVNLDDNDRAMPLLVHAEQVLANSAGGQNSPFLAASRSMLAEIFAARDDYAAAYKLLGPLVASQQRPEVDPTARGRDEYLLAQVAWELGHRDEATDIARRAVADLAVRRELPKTLAEAKAWVAKHRAKR
jgi:eukaryotic-like serine/threonine-protein kinase